MVIINAYSVQIQVQVCSQDLLANFAEIDWIFSKITMHIFIDIF